MASWDTDVRDNPTANSLLPDTVFTEGGDFKTLVSSGESGKERRRSKRSTIRRTWKMQYTSLTDAEATIIYNFFIARKGKYESFSFTCPRSGVGYTVRLTADGMERPWRKNNYNINVGLIEV